MLAAFAANGNEMYQFLAWYSESRTSDQRKLGETISVVPKLELMQLYARI